MKIFKTAFMLASFCALAGSAFAQDKPQEARYIYGGGEIAFVFPSGQAGVLRHGPDGHEVAVSKQLGARGDVLYKGANGHVFVRQSVSGAATYYPHAGSKGLPVSRADISAPILDLSSVEEWGAAYQYKGATTAQAENRPSKTRQEPSN